jgi:spermidine synthase
MLARPQLWRTLASRRSWIRFGLLLAGAAGAIFLLAALVANSALLEAHADLRLAVVCGLGLALIAGARWPQLATAALAAMIAASAVLPSASAPVYAVRSFFGTHRVVDSAGGGYRLLLHGTTVHGIQQNRSGTALISRPTPLAYYHPTGPLARGLQLARTGQPEGALRIGIVGLGTGAMACHVRPGERWRFYEIDPAVVHIATTPSLFRYVARCMPQPDIVLGDARLTLAKESDGSFDYLMVDAFSSDAIPIHLLTVEALRLYFSKLSERGILALHVSNQNLDLPPVLEANLRALGDVTGIYAEGERGSGALASQVILMARDGNRLGEALTWHKARPLNGASVRPWTDDYSDVLSAVWRRYKAKLERSFRGD